MKRFLKSRFASRESVHDYIGVLVPLEEAHLHGHSARCGKTEFESRGSSDEDAISSIGLDEEETELGAAYKHGDHEGTGMLQMDVAEYTIEGLRRDMRKGETGRRWTEYECEFELPAFYDFTWKVSSHHAEDVFS